MVFPLLFRQDLQDYSGLFFILSHFPPARHHARHASKARPPAKQVRRTGEAGGWKLKM